LTLPVHTSSKLERLCDVFREVYVLTGDNKSKIDRIWDAFWSGGISDPLRVIEQISFLLFCRLG
jgi:hypothetical protein